MKDIRLIEYNGRISVFTRPKGGEFFNGRICYLELDSLEDLNEENLAKGNLINLPIDENECVGTNDIYIINDQYLGVLGHLAYKDLEELLHYSAMTFVFQPDSFSVSNFKIIAKRKDFSPGKTKSKGTEDVVFPGGLVKENDGFYLYTGLSDAQIGRIRIS